MLLAISLSVPSSVVFGTLSVMEFDTVYYVVSSDESSLMAVLDTLLMPLVRLE